MSHNSIKLYRKRIIPEELVYLKDDIILHRDPSTIITKWNSLKPRKDFARGISAYYMEEGFKVSKIIDKHNKLVYWYCDLIETEYLPEQQTYIFTDLLADIVVYPDESFRVLDLEEIGDALTTKKLSIEKANKALHLCNDLLHIIYSDQFHKYKKQIEKYDI